MPVTGIRLARVQIDLHRIRTRDIVMQHILIMSVVPRTEDDSLPPVELLIAAILSLGNDGRDAALVIILTDQLHSRCLEADIDTTVLCRR